MTHLIANARTIDLDETTHEPVGDAAPAVTGIHELPEIAGASVGIWGIQPGTYQNTDENELFVVLSGAATITFSPSQDRIEVSAGSIVQLNEGETSLWEVTETLRKVYVCE